MQIRERVISAIAVGLLAFSRTGNAQQYMANIPVQLFAQPTGEFTVGAFDTLWVDARRPERYMKASGTRRKLPVRVWYPAEPGGNLSSAPYVAAPGDFGPGTPYKAIEGIQTRAFLNAGLARSGGRFPVLIYHHGAGWPSFTDTFLAEELASRGYVVFALEHPGLDRLVRFSDGSTFLRDTLKMPAPDPRLDQRAANARTLAFLDTLDFPIWLEDSRFAIDQVEALNNAEGRLKGRLDLDRIGMLGWSFGGATSIEMLRTDTRVKAAINEDGRLFGGATNSPITRPFLLFHHGRDDAAAAPVANREAIRDDIAEARALDSTVRSNARADWYDVTIARTNHGHFSDLSLYLAVFNDSTLMDGRRAHEVIAAYTVAFFDRYLRGRKSALLQGPNDAYPEASLVSSKGGVERNKSQHP